MLAGGECVQERSRSKWAGRPALLRLILMNLLIPVRKLPMVLWLIQSIQSIQSIPALVLFRQLSAAA
jgi:hypothetical protein